MSVTHTLDPMSPSYGGGYWTTSTSNEGAALVNTYIDPKTLKPCKHRWEPAVTEQTAGWTIRPVCHKCGITGSPSDNGVNLSKLVKQLG